MNLYFVLLVCASISSIPLTNAFGTKIEAGERECFVESVEAGGSLSFTYRVTDGGSFDIDATMYATTAPPFRHADDTTRAHYLEHLRNATSSAITVKVNEWRRASDGSQVYTAPSASESKHGLPAEVTVCFDNSFSVVSPKWVIFRFLKRDLIEIDPTSLSRVEAAVEKRLHKHAEVLFDLAIVAERMRQVGESDRVKSETIARYITLELVGNILILLVMAVYQYTTLTRFMTKRGAK